jgi:hypothetical protein
MADLLQEKSDAAATRSAQVQEAVSSEAGPRAAQRGGVLAPSLDVTAFAPHASETPAPQKPRRTRKKAPSATSPETVVPAPAAPEPTAPLPPSSAAPSAKDHSVALSHVVRGDASHPVLRELQSLFLPYARWSQLRVVNPRSENSARLESAPDILLGETGPRGPYEKWLLRDLIVLASVRLLTQISSKKVLIRSLREWDRKNTPVLPPAPSADARPRSSSPPAAEAASADASADPREAPTPPPSDSAPAVEAARPRRRRAARAPAADAPAAPAPAPAPVPASDPVPAAPRARRRRAAGAAVREDAAER